MLSFFENGISVFDNRRRIIVYESARRIEMRLAKALAYMEQGISRKELARKMKISPATASRLVAELRARGNAVQSVRDNEGNWRYELRNFTGQGDTTDRRARS